MDINKTIDSIFMAKLNKKNTFAPVDKG